MSSAVGSESARKPVELSVEGNDGVCFTAGIDGAPFGAGAIHAYLAADRKAPAVVAGISMGALNAAAMQRAYRELNTKGAGAVGDAREAARWSWFRDYVQQLSDHPLNVIWNGIPDQSDFFADMMPIHDPSVPHDLNDDETKARRRLYLLVKLGRWLAGAPMSISRVADVLVSYVRMQEKYPITQKVGAVIRLGYVSLVLLTQLILHACVSPQFFPEQQFQRKRAMPELPWRLPRPLFGWDVYVFLWIHLLSLITYLALAYSAGYSFIEASTWVRFVSFGIIGVIAIPLVPWFPFLSLLLMKGMRSFLYRSGLLGSTWFGRLVNGLYWLATLAVFVDAWRFVNWAFQSWEEYVPPISGFPLSGAFYIAAILLAGTWFVMAFPLIYARYSNWLGRRLSKRVGLNRSIIDDFHMRLKLIQLFESKEKERLGSDPMPIVIVASPLQTLYGTDGKKKYASQLWAQNGTGLVEVLRAAVAVPPLFAPLRLTKKAERDQWLEAGVTAGNDDADLDLIDGAVIRQNPLPALYEFIRRDKTGLAQRLASNNAPKNAAIHVVYRVPVEEKRAAADAAEHVQDIVDVGLLSLRLLQRCDTQLEVEQSNFVSQFALKVNGGKPNVTGPYYSIFADEIAPEQDLTFDKKPLNPPQKTILQAVAEGCRRTMQIIYRKELMAFPGTNPEILCGEFLQSVTKGSRSISADAPGLPEVCSQCTRKLQRPNDEVAVSTSLMAERSLGNQEDFVARHPNLSGDAPRIVFVASGGVFRGSFHIGMLGGLLACGIKPDLIVGASVGTLMCGALGAMLSTNHEILGRLVTTFLHVDDEVALTKILKGAARELGLRGRSVRLSPRQIRRMVLRGSRADAGYAAVGAPPAVVDAISDLFMIPHEKTGKIAAQFIAGHVTDATHQFLKQLKEETLRRLDIQTALIGTSLLEKAANRILAADQLKEGSRQPFGNIAYFGTTTNLITQSSLLLGGYGLHAGAPYSYVQAALASSAFPAVFAPRPESMVFPGIGRRDILFADGGLFDNLPFLPAIEIMSWAQHGFRSSGEGKKMTALEFLEKRHNKPDLIIAGALNAVAEDDPAGAGPFNSLAAIRERRISLAQNVKIRSFEESALKVDQLVDTFIQNPDAESKKTDPHFVDGVVSAAVLSVFPASVECLNPTFAFCASTGLKEWRVLRSITNGCFETLLAFAEKKADSATFAGKAVQGLGDRIPDLKLRHDWVEEGACYFFKKNGNALQCPFMTPDVTRNHPEAREVYVSCKRQSVHWEKIGSVNITSTVPAAP
jgi:predicted acylesterase/phospholipase RssA